MSIDPNKQFPSRECPGCAMEVNANENRCPICGYEFPQPRPFQRHALSWGALVLLILFLVLVLRIF